MKKKQSWSERIKKRNKLGFSLVELIVTISIMAILTAILAPALLSYTERSRAQKDASAMGEVTNAVFLSLADTSVYDELVANSLPENVSCYIDTNDENDHLAYKEVTKAAVGSKLEQYIFNDNARTKDEVKYYAAGSMRGVTITFSPNPSSNESGYVLADGVVNEFLTDGSLKLVDMPYVYNAMRQVMGDEIKLTSQTYRNSDYTIFIKIGSTGGNQASAQDAIEAYGQYSGTNLPVDNVKYYVANNRKVGDPELGVEPSTPETPEVDVTAEFNEFGFYFNQPYQTIIDTDGLLILYEYIFYEDGSASLWVADIEGQYLPTGTFTYENGFISGNGSVVSVSNGGETLCADGIEMNVKFVSEGGILNSVNYKNTAVGVSMIIGEDGSAELYESGVLQMTLPAGSIVVEGHVAKITVGEDTQACPIYPDGSKVMIGEIIIKYSEPVYDDEMPIEWNSMAVSGNVSVVVGDMPLVKISNLTPSAAELAGTEISAIGEVFPCDQSQEMDGIVVAIYAESVIVVSVTVAGEYDDLGVNFPEAGLYVIDFGAMGLPADFVIGLTLPKLDTPIVSLSDRVLNIVPVENAKEYGIYIDGELIYVATETEVDLTEQLLLLQEDCEISICAIPVSEDYRASDYCTIEYSLPTLETPEVSIAGQILTIAPVSGASGYEVRIDNKLICTVTETTVDLSEQLLLLEKACQISVRAIASSGYRISSYCKIQYSLPILAAPEVDLTDKILTITPVENATEYEVYVEGELVCATTATAVDLSSKLDDKGDVYVKVRATSLGSAFPSKSAYVWYSLTMEYGPGLYDADNNLVASWYELVDDYGLNVEKNYRWDYYGQARGQIYGILRDNDGLSAGVKLIIDSSIMRIGAYAFYNAGLTSVIIPDGVVSIGDNAFENSDITNIIVPDSVTTIGSSTFKGCRYLTGVTLQDGLTSIGYWAFYECYGLTSITIPESVIKIDSSAFDKCYYLVEIYNLSSIQMSSSYALGIHTSADVQSKVWTDANGYVFYEDGNMCYLIKYTGDVTTAELPDSCNGKPYVINSYAFQNSVKMAGDLIIPDGVTSIGDYAFWNCAGLTSVIIPNSVTSIGSHAFINCAKITNLTIGNNVTTINEGAFYNCNGLLSIKIPNSVTNIGKEAFRRCTSLTSVTFDENSQLISIGQSAFIYCSSLESITIPNSVTSIGEYALSNCTNLEYNEYDNAYYIGNETNPYLVLMKVKDTSITSISIHDDAKIIYQSALANCTGLTIITFNDTTSKWIAIAKADSWGYNVPTTTYIQCTDGRVDMSGNIIAE